MRWLELDSRRGEQFRGAHPSRVLAMASSPSRTFLKDCFGEGAETNTRGRPFDFAQGRQCAPQTKSRTSLRAATAWQADHIAGRYGRGGGLW
jgi:hypothetical protein